jgi:hypothetical protein
MSSKIALRLAALALGAAFASAPALAQNYYQATPQSPGIGPNGDARYGLYNEEPTYGLYNEAPGMAAPGDQGAVADCAARFRSYDPASGTFLGYDGQRHPCP